MRRLAGSLAAAFLTLASPAAAAPLIGFTDNTPDAASFASLTDVYGNWAVGWTQTVATTDVTVRALLGRSSGGVGGPAAWWITRAIGPGATLADVVASGVYTAPDLALSFDFSAQSRTQLATGLSFAPGSYFLVLDGPPAPMFSGANWVGGTAPDTVELAAGFSLGSYAVAGVGDPPDAFAPASTFQVFDPDLRLVFELEGRVASVPEPTTWGLMLAGFGLAGAALRASRRSARAAAWP